MDYGNQETDEMLFKNCFAKIEEENCLLEKQLIEIWGDLETPSSMKESFLKDLSLSFSQTLSGMVQREENKRAQMAEEVKKVIECCQEVGLKIGKCDQLSQFDSFKTHQHPFSLVVRKKEAMSLLSEMKEEARIRSEKRDSLLSQLNTLSNELEFPLNVGKKGGLSDDELQKLEEEIEKLLSLKSTRLNQLKIITKEIKGLWNELGKPSEKDDFYHKIVNFQLNPTQQELDKVQQKKEELQLTRSQRVSQIREYADSIVILWEKLGVTEEEKTDFFSLTERGLTEGVVNACKAQLDLLQESWEEKIGKVISEKQMKLSKLLSEARYSEEQKKEFWVVTSTELTEQVLEQLDSDFNSVKEIYSQKKPLLALIQKRESYLVAQQELEKSRGDPSRLTSRGSHIHDLLKREEALQKQVKQLPTIEGELEKRIKKWEHERSLNFEIDGKRWLDVLAQEKQEELLRQEQIKKERALKKAEMLKSGESSSTPLRGAAPSPRTPSHKTTLSTSTPSHSKTKPRGTTSKGESKASEFATPRPVSSRRSEVGGGRVPTKKTNRVDTPLPKKESSSSSANKRQSRTVLFGAQEEQTRTGDAKRRKVDPKKPLSSRSSNILPLS